MIEESNLSKFDDFLLELNLGKEFGDLGHELAKALKNHQHEEHQCKSMKLYFPDWKIQRIKFTTSDFSKLCNGGMKAGEWGPWVWVNQVVLMEIGNHRQYFCVCCLEDLPE